MSALVVDLPLNRDRAAAEDEADAFGWMLAQIRSGRPAVEGDAILLGLQDSDCLEISLADAQSIRPLVSLPQAYRKVSSAADMMAVTRTLSLQPADSVSFAQFLSKRWIALDHLGVNISRRDLSETGWQRLIAELAAALPAYRLDVGSPNDIVMIVMDDKGSGPIPVLELVYDRTARRSNFHVCARVAATRAEVERDFPAPYGLYKPGDEPFFRSVAPPFPLNIPAYVDLAFSDGQMTPWSQIVQAMGRRIV